MIYIKILDSHGDQTLVYDPEVEEDFIKATKEFDTLKSKGYTMFSVDPETKETALVDQLFKEQTQVIAIPQISGG